MLLSCDTGPGSPGGLPSYRRDGCERLRIVVAHILYGRIAAGGDHRAALRAMGEFYAVTSRPSREAPLDVLAAVEILGTPEAGATPEPDERLIVAANLIGCIVLRRAQGSPDAQEEHDAKVRYIELLERLDGRRLDARLGPLLARTAAG